MLRTRKIAGTPVRSSAAAWAVAKSLIADTLERSDQIAVGSVEPALAPLDGLAATLVASGAVERSPFTVVAGDLHLEIYIVRGDAAFSIEENLSPVPGGTSAPDTWSVNVQPPPHLLDTVTAAVADSVHITVGTPNDATVSRSASAAHATPVLAINEASLRRVSEGYQ